MFILPNAAGKSGGVFHVTGSGSSGVNPAGQAVPAQYCIQKALKISNEVAQL